MPDLFLKLQREEKKQEQEILRRERQEQFKGVKKAERERVCKLIRDKSYYEEAFNEYRIKKSTLEEIEKGE